MRFRARRIPGVLAAGVMGACLLLGGAPVLSAQEKGAPDGSLDEFPSLAQWARDYLDRVNASLPGEEGDDLLRMDRIRAMYFLSVEDGDWTGPALDSLRALKKDDPRVPGLEGLMEAYRGSLQVVRAKHARWPPNKLKYLNRGGSILDDVVAREPGNLEARYLRFASYVFLPPLLRRDEAVEADVEALAVGLPRRPQALPTDLLPGVVQFILDHSGLDAPARIRLEDIVNG